MSYDILAFEPSAVTDEDFPDWWERQSAWSEEHGYDRVEVTTPALRAFYGAMIREFPPMNGPDAVGDEQAEAAPGAEEAMTDYAIGRELVYVCFRWDQADAAQEAFTRLAERHRVAVAWVSDDGSIDRPET